MNNNDDAREIPSLPSGERAGVRGKEANSNPKRMTISGTVNLRQSPAEPEVSQFEASGDGPSPPRLTHSRIVQSFTTLLQPLRILKLSLWMAMLAELTTTARGGEPIQVTKKGGFAAFESPDGSALYYWKDNDYGIWKMPLPRGEETGYEGLAMPLDHAQSRGNLQVRRRHVCFSKT
jgi:hypothetical protein